MAHPLSPNPLHLETHTNDTSMPESIGKRVDPIYSKTLQARAKELLKTQDDSFPGSQPVCFESRHLSVLEREEYFVCEKTDGVRYLLFFVHSPKGPASFMYDRHRTWHYIPNLVFPVRNRDKEYLKDTLMDGELVADTDGDKKTWRFLVFDLMAINAIPVTQRSFNTRLGMLRQEVLMPFGASLRNLEDSTKPPFTLELKEMQRAYGLRAVFEKISKLKHSSDGVIWTPVKCPYVPGICEKLLKWKPPELTTVDFRISARWSKEHKPMYGLEVLSHGVTYKFYDHFQPEPTLAAEWKNSLPDGRIAEFRYDSNWEVTIVEQGYAPIPRKGGWRFVRFRDDKETANDENVVKKILSSIQDGVTQKQLLAHMDRVRAAWKAREKGLPIPIFESPKDATPSHSTSSTSVNNSILPSPSGHNTQGSFRDSFKEDDAAQTRQNSMDETAQRRSSEASFPTTVETERRPSDYSMTSAPSPSRQSDPSGFDTPENNKREVTYTDSSTDRKRHKVWKEEEEEKEEEEGEGGKVSLQKSSPRTDTITGHVNATETPKATEAPNESDTFSNILSSAPATVPATATAIVTVPVAAPATHQEYATIPFVRKDKITHPIRLPHKKGQTIIERPGDVRRRKISTTLFQDPKEHVYIHHSDTVLDSPAKNPKSRRTDSVDKDTTPPTNQTHQHNQPPFQPQTQSSMPPQPQLQPQLHLAHSQPIDQNSTQLQSRALSLEMSPPEIKQEPQMQSPPVAVAPNSNIPVPPPSFGHIEHPQPQPQSQPQSQPLQSHPQPQLPQQQRIGLVNPPVPTTTDHIRLDSRSKSIPDLSSRPIPSIKERSGRASAPPKTRQSSSSSIHSLLTTTVEPSTAWNASSPPLRHSRQSSLTEEPNRSNLRNFEERPQHPFAFSTILQPEPFSYKLDIVATAKAVGT
ncbi:mRNA capping enzyme, catalytic domain-containing protein [Phycomyces nitens]|nr:mRNA capping enzyme, catalytic domain-containing protein [Phycomyces nitens]